MAGARDPECCELVGNSLLDWTPVSGPYTGPQGVVSLSPVISSLHKGLGHSAQLPWVSQVHPKALLARNLAGSIPLMGTAQGEVLL